jgi:hypothetical protein
MSGSEGVNIIRVNPWLIPSVPTRCPMAHT